MSDETQGQEPALEEDSIEGTTPEQESVEAVEE